jgi:hypothetical protein
MLELYGFILLEIRGIGLLSGLFLLERYQHEMVARILRRQFFYDDQRRISSGVISFKANGIQERVLVRDLRYPPENRSLEAAMRATLEFFRTVTPEAMAIVRERLSGEAHVNHRDEVVFLI